MTFGELSVTCGELTVTCGGLSVIFALTDSRDLKEESWSVTWSIVHDLYLVDQYLGRIDPDLWLVCPRPAEGRKPVLCGGFYL